MLQIFLTMLYLSKGKKTLFSLQIKLYLWRTHIYKVISSKKGVLKYRTFQMYDIIKSDIVNTIYHSCISPKDLSKESFSICMQCNATKNNA